MNIFSPEQWWIYSVQYRYIFAKKYVQHRYFLNITNSFQHSTEVSFMEKYLQCRCFSVQYRIIVNITEYPIKQNMYSTYSILYGEGVFCTVQILFHCVRNYVQYWLFSVPCIVVSELQVFWASSDSSAPIAWQILWTTGRLFWSTVQNSSIYRVVVILDAYGLFEGHHMLRGCSLLTCILTTGASPGI